MKKKLFSTLALLMAIIFVLGACSSNDSTNGSAAKKSAAVKKFPKKPVTLIVPSSAGGGTDETARALASATEPYLRQSIGIVNKPGGSGAIGMTQGANAKPDGYTVTMVFVELTFLHHEGLTPLNYKQFKPIGLINFDPAAITVPADAPYDTLKQFIDYAKKHPGQVKVGNAGTGSIWNLAAASLGKATGVKFNNIPFKGSAPAVTSLVGGHIDAVAVSPAEVLPQVKAGKLKTLAVLSDNRSKVIPDVPTIKEAGFPNVKPIGTWRGLVVPKDTPDAVVQKLEGAFMKGAKTDKFQSFMNKNGLGIKLMNDKDFEAFMKQNDDSFGPLIKDLGLNKN